MIRSVVLVLAVLVVICSCKSPLRLKTKPTLVDLRPAVNQDLIKFVNTNQSTWTAGVNPFMEKKVMQEVKQLLGWKPNGKKLAPLANPPRVQQLPSDFSSATNWPQCSTIGTIYDQARCGSCWAFGAVESISDRFCIASNAKFNQILSFEDMVSCDPDDNGCEGGDAGSAYNYAQESGLVLVLAIPTECQPVHPTKSLA